MKRTTQAGKKSVGYGIVIGIAVSVAVSLLLTLLLSYLVINQKVNESITENAIFVIRLLAAFLGTMAAVKTSEGKSLIVIGIVALSYLVMLISLGIVAYDGSFQKIGNGLLSVLIGTGVSAFIALKPQRKSKRNLKYKR